MGAGILLGLLLLAPSVLAAPSSGELIVQGVLTFPVRAHLDGAPFALFTNETSQIRDAVVVAPRAHLYLGKQVYTYVVENGNRSVLVSPPVEMTEEPLTNVRISLLPSTEGVGWVGIYPDVSQSSLQFATSSSLLMEVLEVSTVGHKESLGPAIGLIEKDGRPDDRRYQRSILEPHFRFQAPGTMHVSGASIVKILGPDLEIVSDERTGVIETGFSTSRDVARQDTYVWAVLVMEQGNFTMTTSGKLDVAVDAPSVDWLGSASFRPVRGHLRTTTETYEATGQPVRLEGNFTATLLARKEANSQVTQMLLQGNLVDTNLLPQAASAPGRAGGSSAMPWLVLFGVAAVVAGGTGILLLRRRERPAVAPSVGAEAANVAALTDDGLQADDCVRFADDAAAERRWARALHWAQRARRLAPENARIRADEGEYLFQLGLFEEAMAAFREASRLEPSEGYADYRGAQAAAAAGRPVDEVMMWLERALERSPDLVGDLELFREFEALRSRVEYEIMVSRAYERLGIEHP